MKILLHAYPRTRKSPLNFGSNQDASPDPKSGFGYRLHNVTSLVVICNCIIILFAWNPY